MKNKLFKRNNRTWDYLIHTLLDDYYKSFFKDLAFIKSIRFVGIGDVFYDESYKNHLFLKLEITDSVLFKLKKLKTNINYKKFIVNVYPDDIKSSMDIKYAIMIVKLPFEYFESYDQFIKGNYSKMYNSTQFKKIFNLSKSSHKIDNIILPALKKWKKEEYILAIKTYIAEEFDVDLAIVPDNSELDIKPIIKWELIKHDNS